MTLEEYLKTQHRLYADFAATVRRILDAALRARPDLAKPQHKQDRSKEERSLRKKLEDRGLLAATDIEAHIKDLAGCRLVFYTNTDLERFLQSRIIRENFDIDQDHTRVHYPVGEDAPPAQLYRALHYVVSLKPDRLALPEYSRFAELRCEIQIQTTLNHAWSETGHDILYKRPTVPGFGKKQQEAIARRFARIMKDYLLPAGLEFQKIKHDYERLMQGKELFDRGVIEELEAATDNNQRWDLLERIRDHVVPYYDDIQSVYPELRRALVKAITDGRASAVKPVETPFGNFAGHTAADVTATALDIVDWLRFVDVDGTFEALCAIAANPADERERKRIGESVDRLAENNLDAWKQVGPGVQSALVSAVAALTPERRKALLSVVTSVCRHALEPDVSGTSSQGDTITFHRGAVVPSEELIATRAKAFDVLCGLYESAEDEDTRRVVLAAMLPATSSPSAGTYGPELLKVILANSQAIVQLFTERIPVESFEMLQHLEHTFLWLYRRNGTAPPGPFSVLAPEMDSLSKAILAFRDAANARTDFVTHKTLVGFEAVFPVHWEKSDADYQERDEYRRKAIEAFIADITRENADAWLQSIKRCASTQSNDIATFPTFVEFLQRLSVEKPDIALQYVRTAEAELIGFLPAILAGLDQSTAREEAVGLVREWIAQGRHLPQIGRRLRLAKEVDVNDIRSLCAKALSASDTVAVIETVVAIVARPELAGTPIVEDTYLPAIRYLTERKDARWLNDAWFQPSSKTFFKALTAAQAEATLENLVYWPDVSWHMEKVLASIAEQHHDLVWDFFRKRMARNAHVEDTRYTPVPFKLSEGSAALGSQPGRAIEIVRSWHGEKEPVIGFYGARLLAIAFPDMSEALEAKLLSLVAAEGEQAFPFVVSVLQNYRGAHSTHNVLKALVDALPEEDDRLGQIESALRGLGVVSGEFGMVEAYKGKKEDVRPWLEDARPKVRVFAERYRKALDNLIASEQEQAEQRRAMRNRDAEDDNPD